MTNTAQHTPPWPTHYTYPFAMVYYGDGQKGIARATNLAFIKEAVAEDGKVTGYKIHRYYPSRGFSKNPSLIKPECVARWFLENRFVMPDKQRIKRAKAAIAKATGKAGA